MTILSATQVVTAGIDMTQFNQLSTAIPATISMLSGIAIILWRKSSTYIIE